MLIVRRNYFEILASSTEAWNGKHFLLSFILYHFSCQGLRYDTIILYYGYEVTDPCIVKLGICNEISDDIRSDSLKLTILTTFLA